MRNRVVATARQNYGGRWYLRGEVIETTTERDAEDIVALNYGRWPEASHSKTRYKRRDLRAEKR